MKDFFQGWDELRRTFSRPERVLWLFDFDGTLAPIAPIPSEAFMPPRARRLLKKLAARFPGHVGVLSGRSLQPLQEKVGIPELLYGGDHGFEIQGPGVRWHHTLGASRQKKLLALAHRIRLMLKDLPKAWLEDKQWTLGIHYRKVRPKDRPKATRMIHRICNLARRQGFKCQQGLKAVEVLSDPRWNKGQAVRWLKRRYRIPQVFYMGDDTTDETVFRVLGHSDVGVHVGSSATTRAHYELAKQSDSIRLLERILTL